MIEIILEEKQDLDFEKLKVLIEDKKKKVGAGYLTDQGALFLVAADLGISLDKSTSTEYGIKEIYVGARDIITTGRILTIHPTKTYTKKDSNQETKNRVLIIYDKDSSIRVKLWDDFINIPEQLQLKSGDLIRISKGQVKSGMDGKPIINISGNTTVEGISDGNREDIPKITQIAKTIDDLDIPKENLVIIGNINSDPRLTEFTNVRGEFTKSLHLELTNESNSRQIRSIIWNVTVENVPKSLTLGSKIRLVGVKTKLGNPNFGNGDLEIHGDEGTTIDFVDEYEVVDNFILRVISFNHHNIENRIHCIAVDDQNKLYWIKIDNNLFNVDIKIDDIVECYPSRILGNTIEITGEDSYIQILKEEKNIPTSEEYDIKIKDVEISNKPLFIEAIILQNPNTANVNTKSGENVFVTDTIIGDDTGEIRLVGWRENSNLIKDLGIGERIKIRAATAVNGKEGNIELTLKPYSSIDRIS